MGQFSEVLSEILPLVASEQKFGSSENRQRLRDATDDLAKIVHTVNFMAQPPYEDPGLRFISRRFDEQIQEVRSDLEAGRVKLARARLRAVTQYCIGCHTLREGLGPDREGKVPAAVASLAPLDRADFYASIRRFDSALLGLEEGLKDPEWAKQHPEQWEQGIQKLLAIIVRVRNDSSLALEMVSRFFDSGSYPKGLDQPARKWRKQLVAWRKDRERLAALKSPDAKLAQVRKWIAESKKAGPGQSGLVMNLLASHWLNQVLPQVVYDKTRRAQEALYLSGSVAESLSELNFWSLPEDYYESCYRLDPKGAFAAKCKQGLSRTLLQRTSIQKLEDLPSDLRQRIQGL